MSEPDLEKTLLDILSRPEVISAAGTKEEIDPKKLFEGMNEVDQQILSRIMESEMKSPSEIVEDQKVALHNERISRERAERLARRNSRRSNK